MKILIITQGISRLVPHLVNSSHKIVGIAESASRNCNKNSMQFKVKSFFIKLAAFFLLPTNNLKLYCNTVKIPYFYITKDNSSDFIDWINCYNPDIIFVSGMSQLLKEEVFSIPKYGAINLHPSYLPEYRGPNPDFWQYYDKEINPGVTVHYIDKGEDTGDIICQERVHIPIGTKSPERLDILIGITGKNLVFKALSLIEMKMVNRVKQPKLSPTIRARNIDLHEHEDIIKWKSWDIETVWNLLRGTESWLNVIEQPGKLCFFYHGQRWSIGGFEKITDFDLRKYELSRIYREEGAYFLACRDGKIYLSVNFQIKDTLKKICNLL